LALPVGQDLWNEVKPMEQEKDSLYDEMAALSKNARVVKTAHFIAAQNRRKAQRIIGVLIIVLNVLIGSSLIEMVASTKTEIIIKLLSFIAAALAGIQTFFNFQKDLECHLNAGDAYDTIYHKAALLMAEYKHNTGSRDATISEFKALNKEYLQTNSDNKGCIPSDKDYDRARDKIKKREGS
jgi:hypothetical protein